MDLSIQTNRLRYNNIFLLVIKVLEGYFETKKDTQLNQVAVNTLRDYLIDCTNDIVFIGD